MELDVRTLRLGLKITHSIILISKNSNVWDTIVMIFFFWVCVVIVSESLVGNMGGPLAHLSIPKEIEHCYRHQKFHTLIIHLLLTWNGTLNTTIAQNNKYQ